MWTPASTSSPASGARRSPRRSGSRSGRATSSLIVPQAQHADLALGWVAADTAAALPGLGRKLPHYAKYSYLTFEGDEPTNIAKGSWPVVESPLTAALELQQRRPDSLVPDTAEP